MGRHDSSDETRRDQALMRAIAAIALVVILIVVYALVFRPFSGLGGRGGADAGMVVGDVTGLPSSSAYVGVILEGEASVQQVVKRHRLGGAIQTGGGTYVLELGGRDAEEVIGELREDPAVHDTGRVFDAPQGSKAP